MFKMSIFLKYLFISLIIFNKLNDSYAARKDKSLIINNISDLKDFKKLLRTKTNVLIIFVYNTKQSNEIINTLKDVANNVKGVATIAQIDCTNSESKKICKKYKLDTNKPFHLKHFKDGEFHKDYDRSKTASSIENFLQDPTGDLPWEEDPAATDILHLADGNALSKFLRKGHGSFKNSLVMFYAPWCGYCKKLKPDYAAAATELKGESILAAIDVSKPGNTRVRQQYNITGFPTLLYFERGFLKFPYVSENTKDAIVQFMMDPTSQPARAPIKDEGWSTDTDVVHLNSENFDATIKKYAHVLAVFYAPWCGHCKQLKPHFERAATTLKKEKHDGILAAVDGTKEPSLASRFKVEGYPTIKYFENGELKFDAGNIREEKKIVEFMQNPQEPPPPPPPELPWSEEVSNVLHLNAANFRTLLKRAKHALVMFYAPWCGHCKAAKPEVTKAADDFSEELGVSVAAVDCTVEQSICKDYEIRGYPTFKYFSFFNKVKKDYTGGRTATDFITFLRNEMKSAIRSVSESDSNKSQFESQVKHLTDDNFEEYISHSDPTFIMFYTTWCPNCTDAKTSFSEAASKLSAEKSNVRFVAVECSDNTVVADLAEIMQIPTFKLYKSGTMIEVFNGHRTAEEFMKFAKDKSGAGTKAKTEL